nr:hypothetical protein [Wolbachia endosymbiont of Litomosoides brasiliensis]
MNKLKYRYKKTPILLLRNEIRIQEKLGLNVIKFTVYRNMQK